MKLIFGYIPTWGFHAPRTGLLSFVETSNPHYKRAFRYIETIPNSNKCLRIEIFQRTNRCFCVLSQEYLHGNRIAYIETPGITTLRKAMIFATDVVRTWVNSIEDIRDDLLCPTCKLPLVYVERVDTTKSTPLENNGVIRFDRQTVDNGELDQYLLCPTLADGRGCNREFPCDTMCDENGRIVIHTVDFGTTDDTTTCVDCGERIGWENSTHSELQICDTCKTKYDMNSLYWDVEADESLDITEFNTNERFRDRYLIGN